MKQVIDIVSRGGFSSLTLRLDGDVGNKFRLFVESRHRGH